MASRASILVLDDDPTVLRSLTEFLKNEGHEVHAADSIGEAMRLIRSVPLNLVFADVYLPDGTAHVLLQQVKPESPRLDVVLMTAYGTIDDAVNAMKCGASNYITKPVVDSELRLVIEQTLRRRALEDETAALRSAVRKECGLDRLVCEHPEMAKVLRLIRTVADTRTTVLLVGESGTGKTVLARAIHLASGRSRGPFVEVSCGALVDSLLETELFGHEAGAFTGATRTREGKFEAAHGGTILLDEIANASPSLQTKLLRVIQESCLERVGGTETISVDVRLVLATNADLAREVAEGRFREDLYYRINVVPVHVPPLRERMGDIPLLVELFIKRFGAELGKAVAGVSPEAMRVFSQYHWPGNVRELEHVIERGVILARGQSIGLDDLPPELRCRPAAQPPTPGATLPLKKALAEPEREIIRQALEHARGSRDEAARILGINRSTLFYRMRKLGMTGRVNGEMIKPGGAIAPASPSSRA